MDLRAKKLLRLPAGAQTECRGDVDGDVRLLRGGKGVAVEADATAAGQLGFYLIASEVRGVVADLGDLVGAWSLDVVQVEGPGDGSDEDVAVLALRAAEVEMREAKNHAVAGITKAGAAAIEGLHVGTDLDQAEGYRGADKRIASPVDADERIDVASVILAWPSRRSFATRHSAPQPAQQARERRARDKSNGEGRTVLFPAW